MGRLIGGLIVMVFLVGAVAWVIWSLVLRI